ncbi:MAG TPA: carbohydrate ABC transporter permease [Candidatus Limnocylindrales bacterium]|nr:carbohydrate ABC transporter permease [Candidatus Limnocylindrales bacterium]
MSAETIVAPRQATGLSIRDRGPVARAYRRYLGRAGLTMVALVVVSAYLLPLLYMVTTAFQQPGQSATPGAPVYPAAPMTGTYQGEEYAIYSVPIDGSVRQLMLLEPGRESSIFVDPNDPSGSPIEWQGHWRTLEQAWRFAPLVENFTTAWNQLNFPRLLLNTAGIAILSTIGAVISSTLVAYGFARFRFPGRNALFIVLIATIILPFQVTLLPTYVIFTTLGWNGTWLPLIIPHCFANAYNVFLLRQYFLSIPRDLDEAAMIDGAGPFRILRSIIAPQSVAAITAVALFHFFFAWNDFFLPLLYLADKPELQPVSIAIQQYNAAYATQPTLIQATALMTMAVPIVVFFLAQRAFMRGVVVTGVDK